ncbi:60S ribosomal protein L2, partial [Saccharata proteae CBS 121410]
MLLPRLQAPARAALHASRTTPAASIHASYNVLDVLRASIAASSPTLTSVRHASHQAQGRANGVKNGPGPRLGAKKTGEQYVVPGNIIFRQRGTKWFPGENCAMGRDHTIHATQPGYVKFYRDPYLHPKRQYIGVVFSRNDTLPRAPHAARRRRLGLIAVPRNTRSEQDSFASGATAAGDAAGVAADLGVSGTKPGQEITVRDVPKKQRGRIPASELTLRPGYMYREANWQIGRTAERAGIKTREFVPGDRFRAWKKRYAGVRRAAEKKQMARAGKK